MAPGALRLALAGGVNDPEHPLGTDALRVAAAIEQVHGPDGVVVLMDLGSALLSAELALDLLPEEVSRGVVLCDAPLVEGLVAAAVQAAAGASLEVVVAEARGALAAKAAHLAGSGTERSVLAAAGSSLAEPGGGSAVRLTVRNPLGFHARPVARLVTALSGHDADVTISDATTGRGPVPARSVNALLTLGASHGHELVARATGPDAERALAALVDLAASGFGDGVTAAAPAASPDDQPAADAGARRLRGLPASPGIAIGRVHQAGAPARRAGTGPGNAADEGERLRLALQQAAGAIAAAQTALALRAGADAGEVLDAHLLLLTDPQLADHALQAIETEHLGAEDAWRRAVATARAGYEALEDAYLAARGADLDAVAAEVLAQLQPGGEGDDPGGVLVARELSPTAAARLDPAQVDAIVTAEGSPTSHAALVARALGIPAVVGAGAAVLGLAAGTQVVVDGGTGVVDVDPDGDALDRARRAVADRAAVLAEARQHAAAAASTGDGTAVAVLANVGLPGDADRARAAGADGIGLLRSEFLFGDSAQPPDEAAQVAAYTAICDAIPGRPVVLRTLDVGGDKPLACVPVDPEANPFLGLRGIRLGLRRPALLRTQLRAALRVAATRPLRVMVPMVSTLEEIAQVRALADEVRAELARDGLPAGQRVDLGVMVEVPALALAAEHAAAAVDFLSIGTNDLTQYTLAAERGNPAVAHLADPADPAVLRLIAAVCNAAAATGTPVAVCGDMAADLAAVPLLLGLGVRELSVPPPDVPLVKQRVRSTDLRAAEDLAAQALRATSARAVRKLLGTISAAEVRPAPASTCQMSRQ